jgi:hypothetical protein
LFSDTRLSGQLASAIRDAVSAAHLSEAVYCLALHYSKNAAPTDVHVALGDVHYRDGEIDRAAQEGELPLLFAPLEFGIEIDDADIRGRIGDDLIAYAEELGERWELTEDETAAADFFEGVARRLVEDPPVIERADDFVVVPVDTRDEHTAASFDRVVAAPLAAYYREKRWHPADS